MSNSFIIYISQRKDPSNNLLVRDIAIDASQKNRQKGISGILMAIDNYFLQVLEGQDDSLEELLSRIAKDDRHSDLRVLYRGQLPDRIFGQWSMGCVHSRTTATHSTELLDAISAQIRELCEGMNTTKCEELKNLIVKISSLISENRLSVT